MTSNHRHLVFGLTYHGSIAEPLGGLDNFFGKHISAGRLRRQLDWTRRHFHILTIAQIYDQLRRGTLPRRSAFIAFHDGYAGNYDIAFPMLKELGITAGFYIPTAFIGAADRFWVDMLDSAVKHSRAEGIARDGQSPSEILPLSSGSLRMEAAAMLRRHLKALPQKSLETEFQRIIAALGWEEPQRVPRLGDHERCMTWDQIKEMAKAGMEIGSHTHHHLICARQDDPSLRAELTESKKLIEDQLQMECQYFCYPNGSYPASGNDHTDRVAGDCGYQAVLYMTSPYNLLDPQSFRLTGMALGEETSDRKFKGALSRMRFRWQRLRRRPIWPWDENREEASG